MHLDDMQMTEIGNRWKQCLRIETDTNLWNKAENAAKWYAMHISGVDCNSF